MDQEKKVIKVAVVGQEEETSLVRNNYIKPYVLVKFGKEIATILATAYSAQSAADKLVGCQAILACAIKDEAKIKFIGDVMTRPKKERISISRKIFKLLEGDEKK